MREWENQNGSNVLWQSMSLLEKKNHVPKKVEVMYVPKSPAPSMIFCRFLDVTDLKYQIIKNEKNK